MFQTLFIILMFALPLIVIWFAVALFMLLFPSKRMRAKKNIRLSIIAFIGSITTMLGSIFLDPRNDDDYSVASQVNLEKTEEPSGTENKKTEEPPPAEKRQIEETPPATTTPSKEKSVVNKCPSGGGVGMAFVMSQRFVKNRLKAPTTAKFPYEPTGSMVLGTCSYRIKAYVDAQNAFGAMLRSEYVIDMKYNPDSKRWSGSNLKM